MKKDTVVRLHLTKQLFESLTKQLVAEAKKGDMSGGAYTEAVKASKEEKKDTKSEKNEAFELSKNSTSNKVKGSPKSVGELSQKLLQISRQLRMMKGIDGSEIQGVDALLDDIIGKLQSGNIGVAVKAADKTFNAATKGIKEMETEVAEGDLEEIDLTDPMVVAPALAFLGSAAAVVTGLLKDLKNAKTPEERQSILKNISGAIERSKGTNEGAEKKKEALKEYEVIYVVRNGKCYRKDDEGNMDEVSMNKCR